MAYKALVNRTGRNFRMITQQATMYELMKTDRSVHAKLDAGEKELALPTNERLLDVAFYGPETGRPRNRRVHAATGGCDHQQ